MQNEMNHLMVDDRVPVLLRVHSQDIHHFCLGSVAGTEGVERSKRRLGEGVNTNRFLIVAVAVLVTAFGGLISAQSIAPAVQVDQTSQTKPNQKNSKQKPSATKTSKAQDKKATSSQNAAYAAAYKAEIPHSNTPAAHGGDAFGKNALLHALSDAERPPQLCIVPCRLFSDQWGMTHCLIFLRVRPSVFPSKTL